MRLRKVNNILRFAHRIELRDVGLDYMHNCTMTVWLFDVATARTASSNDTSINAFSINSMDYIFILLLYHHIIIIQWKFQKFVPEIVKRKFYTYE